MTAGERPELLRLARVLGTEADALAFLEDASDADLRQLRDAISDHLLQRNRRHFENAVALAGVLPSPLAAKLAQFAMGPVLAGRAAALLKPGQAGDLAKRLPPDFLADVVVNADLRHVGALLPEIPTKTLVKAGAELARREEWIVLGAVMKHIELDVLAQVIPVFDGEALLRIGFVVEDPTRLDAVIALLGDERLDEILEAAHACDLWTEAVAIVAHISPQQGARIVAAIERLEAEALDRLADVLVAEVELRTAAQPLIALAPEHLRSRIET